MAAAAYINGFVETSSGKKYFGHLNIADSGTKATFGYSGTDLVIVGRILETSLALIPLKQAEIHLNMGCPSGDDIIQLGVGV